MFDWIKSRRQDRQRLSNEKYEIRYVKSLAKKYLNLTKDMEEHKQALVRVSSLRRMCQYILKK